MTFRPFEIWLRLATFGGAIDPFDFGYISGRQALAFVSTIRLLQHHRQSVLGSIMRPSTLATSLAVYSCGVMFALQYRYDVTAQQKWNWASAFILENHDSVTCLADRSWRSFFGPRPCISIIFIHIWFAAFVHAGSWKTCLQSTHWLSFRIHFLFYFVSTLTIWLWLHALLYRWGWYAVTIWLCQHVCARHI